MNLHLYLLLIIACGSSSHAYFYTSFSTCPSSSGNRLRVEPATLGCGSKRVQQGSCPRGQRFPHNSAKYSTMAMTTSATWPPADRLSDYVTDSYLVDYKKLAAEEKDWLSGSISSIKKTDPAKMEKADKHAFLINAYNLWTLHWVIRERKCPRWKGHVSTFAKARFFYWHKISTGQGKRNLYNFENKDIRPEVNDARVHFALNCASISCPPLRRTLFTGAGLDAELNEVTSAAINGGVFVQLLEDGNLLVNPIFKWYKDDFDKEGGILAFIKKHWTGSPLSEDATIEFFGYDWRSNSSDAAWADRALGGPAP